jgi:predicted transcriptional regulator
MQVEASIKGENIRIRILDYMEGKEVTSGEIQEALNLSKYQVDHFIKTLRNSRHIYRERLSGCSYKYGRTSVGYIVKDYSKFLDKATDEELVEVNEEDTVELKPTVPHARIIRLLKTPIAPPPRRKGGHMFSGIQSGLGMFDGA